MTTYYVGSGGNDGNSGLTWAQRKLTLNGAEDIPVVANDTVYVGPGVYRESLTCDVNGAAGNPITYIGDVFGQITDGVGGLVRITGSNDDLTATRAYGINIGARNYRTFRGFRIDGCTTRAIKFNGGSNAIIEDCVEAHCVRALFMQNGELNNTLRRCVFAFNANETILIYSLGGIANAGHVIENCLIINGWYRNVYINGVGGVAIRNCLVSGGQRGIASINLPGGYTAITVNNSIVCNHDIAGVEAAVLGQIVEDYNAIVQNTTNLANVAAGANSLVYLPMLALPVLIDGYQMAWNFGKLAPWSGVTAQAGVNVPVNDLHGFTRAVPSSWGPFQHEATRRDWDSGESRGRRGV